MLLTETARHLFAAVLVALYLVPILYSLILHAEDPMMTETPFGDYLRRFDYDERVAMKIQLPELLTLYAAGQAQLIDIRFHEEYAAWRVGIGQHIPLNELPDRLDELDGSKTIVTMCPHYDRAEIARLFLTLQGFHSRYLTDGMLGIANHLRGDIARDYMARIATDPHTN